MKEGEKPSTNIIILPPPLCEDVAAKMNYIEAPTQASEDEEVQTVLIGSDTGDKVS